jgi:hypothetical protein
MDTLVSVVHDELSDHPLYAEIMRILQPKMMH